MVDPMLVFYTYAGVFAVLSGGFTFIATWMYNNVWIPRTWPYKVRLIEPRSGGKMLRPYIIEDRAKVIEHKDGRYDLILKKEKGITTKPVNYEDIMIGVRNTGYIDLYCPRRGVAIPVKFSPTSEDKAEYKTITEDDRRWRLMKYKEKDIYYADDKGMLERMAPFALPVAIVMVFAFMFLFYLHTTNAINQMISTGIANEQKMAETLTQAMQNMGSGPAVVPPEIANPDAGFPGVPDNIPMPP